MRSAFLVVAVMASGLALAPGDARAETRVGLSIQLGGGHRPGYGHGYAPDTFRLGYSRGYQDGYNEGLDDGRDDDRFEFWREGRYRDGDSGYKGHFGPKHLYVQGYRRGYESAYRRAYALGRHGEGHYGRHPYGDDRWPYGYDPDRDDRDRDERHYDREHLYERPYRRY
jgi:hypothetical protein